MKKIINKLFFVVSVLTISACSITTLPSDARAAIQQADSNIESTNKMMANIKPGDRQNFITHSKGGYLSFNSQPIADADYLPPVFSEQIKIDQLFYSMYDVSDRLSSLTRIPVLVNVNDPSSEPIRVTQNDGNLIDLLTTITRKTNTAWTYENGKIIISDYQTKRWRIDAVPGDITVQNSIANNAGIQGQAGGGNATVGSSAGGSTSSTSQSQASQNSSTIQNVAFNLQNSLWESLKASVKSMLSPKGTMNIDPSTSSIVVTDKPSVITLVDSFIQKENKDINRQVIVDVKVYRLTTDRNDNYGLNWNLALQGTQGSFTINGQAVNSSSSGGGAGFTPSPVFVPTATTQAFTIGATSGDLNGSQLAVNALSSIGKLSEVTSSSHATLSYQPAPFQFVEQQGYLASVQTTQTAQVGSQTALSPGQVTIGYSLNILPVVKDNDQIILQVAVNISSLKNMKVFSSQGAQIELPDLQLGNTMQKIKIHNGETFVMSGFDSDMNSVLNQGVGGAGNWLFGGGVTAAQTKSRLYMLITPHIIGS